jgi:Xaa-Pro aminopeptidase
VAKPGIPEYAVEGELTAAYLRHGATGQGFMPIIASGRGSTIIHYLHNDATIASDDLVLFDTGAEAGYYAADISRTVPAAGRFTPRQRALYEAVYRTQQAAIPLHKPGATIWSIDEFMRDHLLEELVGLKVLTAAQAKSKDKFKLLHQYYGHISHHLGLDCHDNSDFRTPFKPGMIVTCEPGLYLREEGIGVRIEDDILITDTGCEVLSKAIPSDPDKLEALMQKSSAKKGPN